MYQTNPQTIVVSTYHRFNSYGKSYVVVVPTDMDGTIADTVFDKF